MPAGFRFEARDKLVMLVVSAFVLQVFFFAPLEVLAQNFGEFSVLFIDVLTVYLALSIVLIVLLWLALRFLKAPVFLSTLTFLSSIAFLESRFFLGFAGHHPFDGKPINWAAFQWLSYIEIVTILVLGALFARYRRQTHTLSVVSLFILVFTTMGFIHDMYVYSEALEPSRQTSEIDSPYLDQFYRLSGERNIIHIVPDQTQGAMLHDILVSNYEHYAKVFDGFTLFTQAIGRYKGTYPSVLYYMAGEAPEVKSDLVLNQPFTRKYIEESLQQRSIVSLLSRNGFKTFGFQFHPGIFCKGPFTACTGTHEEVFGGVAIKSEESRLVLAVLTAMDLTLFQITPLIMRERIYDNGHWFTRKLDKGVVTHSGILDRLMRDMQLEETPGSYNYFHHAGAHAPLLFDRNCKYIGPQAVNRQNQHEQVICTLEQIENLIQALKRIGVYDQTMIVINGDHGSPWLPPSYPGQSGKLISEALIGMASTLVLIKPPGERGPLDFSDRAVTIGDIPATIAGAFGLEHTYSGVQMFDDEATTERERHYFTYDSAAKAHSLQALPNMSRYRIQGDVFDERNWVLPNSAIVGAYPSQLRMDQDEFLRYAQGFSFLEHHDAPKRWVDGTKARVFLAPPSQGSMALVFESYLPPSIEGQWMEISVGGRFIERLDENALRGGRHIVLLPDGLPQDGVLEIEFTLGKTMNSSKDPRQLSILFSYIGLEPAG